MIEKMDYNRKYTVDWTSFHIKNWENWLVDFINKDNILALEIGCYEGRSSCWFCENILTGNNSKLTCVDDWSTNKSEKIFDDNIRGLNINKIKGQSQFVLPLLITKKSKYNFIYLDGDHLASSVLKDLSFSWELLKSGGIIICDDYDWTSKKRNIPPKIAIDSWISCNINDITGYEIRSQQCAIWKK